MYIYLPYIVLYAFGCCNLTQQFGLCVSTWNIVKNTCILSFYLRLVLRVVTSSLKSQQVDQQRHRKLGTSERRLNVRQRQHNKRVEGWKSSRRGVVPGMLLKLPHYITAEEYLWVQKNGSWNLWEEKMWLHWMQFKNKLAFFVMNQEWYVFCFMNTWMGMALLIKQPRALEEKQVLPEFCT